MSSPLDPARRLAARLRAAAAEVGLELHDFSLTPTEEGDQASAMFGLSPQQSKRTIEDDPEFDAIVLAEQQRALEKRVEQDRAALTELRDSLTDKRKGIGLDEDLQHPAPPDPGE